MMYVRKITSCVLLSAITNAHAGWYANTAHSRANCMGFNESITWNWSEYHWWAVRSIHFKQKGTGPGTHPVNVFMSYTWRAAAFDFMKDPAGGNADQYWVQGYHWYMAYDSSVIFDAYTQAGNCAIYDGWWEKNKANGE